MAIKIRKKRTRSTHSLRASHAHQTPTDDLVEVGEGGYCVIRYNYLDGTMVAHRYQTQEEAQAHLARNNPQEHAL